MTLMLSLATVLLLCSASIAAAGLQHSLGEAPALSVYPHASSKATLLKDLPRPDKDQAALMARWLVHVTSWGTLSTLIKDSDHTGWPNGAVKSHSDGVGTDAWGRVFMYLSPVDVSTQDLMANSKSSYTVSEIQLESNPGGTSMCHGVDAEDPTCAKVTLIGTTRLVPEEDRQFALDAIFSRHPSFKRWPDDHHFAAYELHVEEALLLDWYGGMKVISGQDYYSASFDDPTATS